MIDPPVDTFRVEVHNEAEVVAVDVHGEVDAATAARLVSVLDGLLAHGHRCLVVDLGYLRSMDAAGLRIVAESSSRLERLGATVTLRAAPLITRRILDLTRSTPPAEFDLGEDPTTLAEQGSELARVPLRPGPETADAALRLVTTLAAATIGNADGVSLTLEREGQLMTVAASNPHVLPMDACQYESGEGPCLSARADGCWYYVGSLADEERWPAFVQRALTHGMHSILSSPLMGADRPLGSLNLYSDRISAFTPRDQQVAALFAAQAADVLTRAHTGTDDDQLRERWSEGLVERQTLALAQGVLMHHHHVSASSAKEIIYESARAAQLTVGQYATALLTPYVDDDDLDNRVT